MNILDLTCRNCGCEYEVDEMGMSFIIHHENKEIESDEIKCPICESVSYSERYLDDYWEED
jgi:RNA polymerase subunit RPABC4/transcription elongation factor Spt4